MRSTERANMTTTTETPPDSEALGEVARCYARNLSTALIAAGTPGRVSQGQYDAGSAAAQECDHTQWPFVLLRVGGHDVRTFCMPGRTGIVLMVHIEGGPAPRWLFTWGAPAAAFGPATLAVARGIIENITPDLL